MKTSIKKLFVIMAIVMSFVAVQNACAETVEGTIDAISTRPNVVTVEGSDVYGVKFNSLYKLSDIVLTVDQDVSFEVYDCECNDGTIVSKACTITADDIYGIEQIVVLRPCP